MKNKNHNKHSENKVKMVKAVNNKEVEKELKKNKKVKSGNKHPKLKKFILIVVVLIILMMIIGTGIFAGIFFSDKWQISKDDLALSNIDTTMYDKDGIAIGSVSGLEKRKVISLDKIPKNLQNAYIAIEDKTFYSHHGINLKRTLGAAVTYIIHKGSSSYGGSTITQQLVKNLMKDKDDKGMAGMLRKVREMSRAYQVEKILSKDQILELYLNLIFMGGDANGVELGSQYYFNKSVTDLDLAECAFLAGINHSPNNYNPFGDKDNSTIIKTRTETVLNEMKSQKKISEDDYNTAKAEVEAGLKFSKGNTSSASTMSYLAKAALNQVVKQYAEEKDFTTEYATTKIYGGGYKIYTTQDSAMQSVLEGIYKDDDYIVSNKKSHAQSAMVVTDYRTGNVVATMGGLGTDVDSNGLNRATQSTRQPGSSMKPIASIAPGLENGTITAATVYDDSPTSFGSYRPKNSGNKYQGLSTVRKAIQVSANVVEVKIMSELGPSNSIAFLRKLGITSLVTAKENPGKNDENLAMVLGGLTHGISPLEMAGAYSAIANDGVYITPTFYTKVEDAYGNVVLEAKQDKTRVMSEGNAYIEKTILRGPVSSGGTAPGCKISNMDTGGKTGTTDDNHDRWFCGFTPYYCAATWYGYDDNTELNTGYTNYAAKIWAAAMKKIHANLEGKDFEKPSNIVTATICLDSGKKATSSCARTYEEYFVQGTVPDSCEGHKKLRICKETGKIATEFCPDTEEKTFLVKPDKENTTSWKTDDSDKYDIPTETCTVHTQKILKMPNLIGTDQADAEKQLKALGATVTVTEKESADSAGKVIAQSKSAGETISAGEKITITVGKKGTSKPSDPTNTIDKTNTTE